MWDSIRFEATKLHERLKQEGENMTLEECIAQVIKEKKGHEKEQKSPNAATKNPPKEK